VLLLLVADLSGTRHPVRAQRLQNLQILPFKVPRCLQEKEEPKEGEMDKGVQENGRQGISRRPSLRVREEETLSGQVQPRGLAEVAGGDEGGRDHQAEETGALCDAASAEGSRDRTAAGREGGTPRHATHQGGRGRLEAAPRGGHCRRGARERHRDGGRGGGLKSCASALSSCRVGQRLIHLFSCIQNYTIYLKI